ncbi:MAG TPA: pseudouridine synthase [Pirellulaceae bacterium]|nr:pseudouridine synthase [Pirellulaceae bacterium]
MPPRRPAPKTRRASTGRRSTNSNVPNRAEHESAGVERLQKVLAAAGVGSRRDCEELILEGRVEVDGAIVQTLGTRVDPLTQRIRVDGTTLPTPRRVYYMLNKPPGVLCTNNDPSGRARAVDLIRSNERLFTVGRLDQASEGLIILTNDGELANQLTHPRYGIDKVYRVRVAGSPEPAVLGKLRQGVHFADGFAKVSDVRIRSRQKQSTDLEIVLNEGRNREIRRLLARIGHKVLSLTRIAMGPLRLGELPSGAHRSLTRDEVKSLRNAAPAASGDSARPTTRKPPRGRSKPPRTAAAPRLKPKSKVFTSSAAPPTRKKAQPREFSFSDQPMPGAILGGDEVPEVKVTTKPGTQKASSRRPNSRTATTNSTASKRSGRKSGRSKPAKKERR